MIKGPPSELPLEALHAIIETADNAGIGLVVSRTADPPEIVFASPGLLSLLGYTLDEFRGMPIWDHIPTASRDGVRERHRRRLAGENVPRRFEVWATRRDGTAVPFEVTTTYVDLAGHPGSVNFLYDISERKASQEKLIQADRLAAVGTLAAGIAHEINNPLAYVLLGLQYLEREVPKISADADRLKDVQARLRDVRTGAERVGIIVRDLKTFARADEVALGPVDLREAIEAALKIAENEVRHRAVLVRDYVDAPPVEGNAARLEQVFLNLIVNAAHAVTEKGGAGEVRVSVRPDGPDRVVAEVRDDGKGIPADVMSRVFDPFFTTKPIGVGTGLGLPICRNIVESLGGTIDLSSELGHGTAARIVLRPYARVGFRLPSEAPQREPSLPPDSRGRVLIVDDEPAISAMLSRSLSPQYEVATVSSGAEALQAIEQTPFDAILCDVMMPGMTGVDLYRTIRQKDPSLSDRIVFMSGGTFVAQTAELLSSLENPKLEKPFDWPAVTSALRQVMERSNARQRTEA